MSTTTLYRINEKIDIQLTPKYEFLASADSFAIEYKSPSGLTGQWTAVLYGNYIRYITTTANIVEVGRWAFRAVAVFGSETKKAPEWVYRTFKP